MKNRLFIIWILLLCWFPLRAQWSGSADLSAGMGAMEGSEVNDNMPMFHGLAQGNFLLNYKTPKFSWSTRVEGKWEPKTTDNARLAYKDKKLEAVYKAASTMPLTASIRSDFAWTPSRTRNYAAWIKYQYKNDHAQNHSMNMGGTDQEIQKFSYYYEVPVLDEHKLETGVKTHRGFDSGRSVLESSLTFKATGSQRVNTWIIFKAGEGAGSGTGTAVNVEDVQGYAWKYRITPNSLDLNLDGDIHLQRHPLDGAASLKYAPGLRISTRHMLDENSGATRINVSMDESVQEVWRDSTRLRENFNYLMLRTEPYIILDFKWRNIEARADYACQIFARRLSDDTHWQPLQVKGVYPVGKGNVKWTISPSHSLNLKNELSVAHPDYLKICWYDRTAGYLDQLYRGNEQLKSPRTCLFGLDYQFQYKRFVSKTGISYKNVMDEVDQTWSNKVIENREYKVFEWLNSADSYTLGLTQSFGWRGKVITANIGLTYNNSRRIAKSNGAIKNSFDWKLTSDIAANLGKGWSVGANAKYQSKVATFFTIFKQYCELNAYVQKEFKKVTLYLQGKDLLDQTKETSFLSEETQEFWIEQVRNNRRIFVLGVKWKF